MFGRSTNDPSASTADAGPAVLVEAPVPDTTADERASVERGSVLEVLRVATRLGLTCFGGPIAHLGYFRDEYVVKRRWLDEKSYADLVALCQFLPGAASSKVSMSIGILRAGLLGGLAAWIGFTLPSAVALMALALALRGVGSGTIGLMHGLKVVAVAVVAQAVWGMARNLAPDRPRAGIAIAATAGVFALPTKIGQIVVIVTAALVGWRFLRPGAEATGRRLAVRIPRWLSIGAWVTLVVLLIGLPIARALVNYQPLALVDSFYRSGSLVFGGGHVVLPLLQHEVVPQWVSQDQALAGYGLAQAVPGPLFTYAAYLGSVVSPEPNGVLGGTIALVAIFLPSILLTLAALPLWSSLRGHPNAQAALRGVNAAVVGILIAALYSPVWTSAIHNQADFALGLGAFGLLVIWRFPPWLVVLTTGAIGALITVVH